MKKIILYMFIFSFPLLVINSELNAQELIFSVQLDKTSYTKGEPVKCMLSIRNNSKKNLVVNNRFLVNMPSGPHEVSLVIANPDQRTVFFRSMVNASSQSDSYILLRPGTSTTSNYTISSDFKFSKPGKYNITAYYENKNDPPGKLGLSSAWKGSLVAAKTSFTIR